MRLSARSLARVVTVLYAIALFAGVLKFAPGCVSLVIWASQEKSDLLAVIADRYATTRPSEDLRCVRIEVVRKASGEAEDTLKRAGATGGATYPDVWSPAASTWLRLLDRDRALAGVQSIIPASAPPIIQSPLVIAMPEPMARSLGWPAADVTWKDIFALARDPQGWAARGHPDWQRFKLAKTNPEVSTSGLHTLLSTYVVSGGTAPDDPKVFGFMKDVESSVVHYSSTVSNFLVNLWQEDDRGTSLSYVSAIALEEQQIWQYNRGNPEFGPVPAHLLPRTRLVALYPSEGTFIADHPYVVMPWADEQKQRAALRFLDYLKSDAVQQEFMSNAFRGARGETGAPLNDDNAFNRFKPSIVFSMPTPAVIEQVQSSWGAYRKRARVLVIIDTSASMGASVAQSSSLFDCRPASNTKLELAISAWADALDGFVDEDDVGLWALSGVDRRRLVDIAPLRDGRARLRSDLAALSPGGAGKALYAAITEGVAAVRQHFARDRINAVVVLTDGRNDDVNNSDRNGLLRNLLTQSDDDRVRVFTVAYGPAADRDSLEMIARAARGTFFEATDARVINRVIADVVSSF